MNFFGPSDKRDTLEPLLIWATPGQRGFVQPALSVSMSDMNHTHTIPGVSMRSHTSVYTSSYPSSSRYPSSSKYLPIQNRAWDAGLSALQTAAQQAPRRGQAEALHKAAELKQLLSSLEKINDEGRRGSVLDALCSVDDILLLPEHESPPSILNGELKVDLLRHQVSHSCYVPLINT